MKTSGDALDPLYVAARTALLDALEAVSPHLDAVILVGAQAVYVHAGDGDLQVAPYTTDADIALDPERLGATPLLEEALGHAGFVRASKDDVGAWTKRIAIERDSVPVVVDLLVPDSVGGDGRRAARIPPHDKRAARKVVGLEGALVDRDVHRLSSLDGVDGRGFDIAVAGPGALLVAKSFKIIERADDRRSDKDALDVLRLLRATPTADLANRLSRLQADPRSASVTAVGLEHLATLFGESNRLGCEMAARAASPFERPETIAASAAALMQDLLREM
jgi:hypothetical protein